MGLYFIFATLKKFIRIMKKSILTLMGAAVLVGSLFTSCKKDEAAKVAPTVSFVPDATTAEVAKKGDTYQLSVSYHADQKLKSVTVNRTVGASKSTFKAAITTFSNATDYTEVYTLTCDSTTGKSEYEFVVVDADGQTASKTLTLNAKAAPTGTLLATEKTGLFYNVNGKGTGAYDLVADASVAASGAETSKDMKNIDKAGTAFTGSWGTGTGNTTMYVKANTFTYATATVEAAAAAYAAGSASANITGPAKDDIYIAKLRGGSDYAVIKITALEPTNNDPGSASNFGKITFSYKKK